MASFVQFAKVPPSREVSLSKSAAPETKSPSASKMGVGYVEGLENVYRAADCVITTHKIATRTVREALACGTNVVMDYNNSSYTPFQADPEDLEDYASVIETACFNKSMDENRDTAIIHFNSENTAKEFIRSVRHILA